MSRTISSAANTAAQASSVRPFVLVDLDFTSGLIYVNSSDRTLTWSTHDYLGVGVLGKISAPTEAVDLTATGLSLELTGVPTDYINIALAQYYQGRACTVRLGFLDANYQIIVDPIIIFAGRMDQMVVQLGATATVALSAESRLIDWEADRTRRYTDADQQAFFPGDLGMQFVAATADAKIIWGAGSGTSPGATVGSPSDGIQSGTPNNVNDSSGDGGTGSGDE